MKLVFTLMRFCLIGLFCIAGQVFGQEYIPGQLYIKYVGQTVSNGAARPVAAPEEAIMQAGGYNIRPAFPGSRIGTGKTAAAGTSALSLIMRVNFPEASDMEYLAGKLSAHPAIEYAEPVFINHVCREPNDPDYLMTGSNARQEYLRFINAPGAWEVSQGDTSVVIAIVDTGTDWTHPDLESQVWINPGEIPDNGLDDDSNGWIDDVHGIDLYGDGNEYDADPIAVGQSHGTHVAGIAAAATDNGVGIASLGWNLRFMPVKTSADNDDEIYFGYEGIEYAARNGADIINCSWGSSRRSRVAEEVVKSAQDQGVLIIAAAGNDSTDIPFYPAAYSQVVSVGSIDIDGSRSYFSNYGAYVDVYAPGSSIYSTLLGSSYGNFSGTSMASPVVASLAGLIKGAHPDWDMDQVKAQLLGTVTPMPEDMYLCGCGYIDAERALGEPPLYIEVAASAFSDSIDGDGDGLFRPGETIRGVFTVNNLGEDTGPVLITASSLTGYLEPITASVSLGSFAHGEERITDDFTFMIAEEVPPDARELIRLDFTADGGSIGISITDVRLNPSFATLAANTIGLSFGDRGQLGFIDYPANEMGTAFVIYSDNPAPGDLFETPLLFEGGLMFGTSAEHVSDSVRGSDQYVADTDFIPANATSLEEVEGVQTGTTSFIDSNGGVTPVDVSFTGYAWDDPELAQSILLTYTLANESQQDISGARAGLFLDFDLPVSYPWDDQTYYVSEDDIIVFDGDLTEVESKLLVGVAAIPGIDSPWLIENAYDSFIPGDEFGIYDGFTNAEKWQGLSGGKDGRTSVVDHDVSAIAGAPVFDLPAGSEYELGFIIAYGVGYLELRETIQAARERAAQVITAITTPASGRQVVFALTGVHPNPFNQAVSISFMLPEQSDTELAVYSITGQRIRTLLTGTTEPGAHTVRWDGRDEQGALVASGVYLLRLVSGGQTAVSRMTLLK